MQLFELLQTLNYSVPCGSLEIPISKIVFDSRRVSSGTLFVAKKGDTVDGHSFISAAIEAGASGVLAERFSPEQIEIATSKNCTLIQVEDSAHDGGIAVAAFYGFPANKMTMIGVTGTDGKTTTSTLMYYLLKSSGVKVGLISTISAKIFDGTKELEHDTGFHVTSPEVEDIQSYLAEMVEHGCNYAIVESTSHGFVQERMAGINFDVGIVTNITHEHLDYHKTIERYVLAKSRLFRIDAALPEKENSPRLAVINQDDHAWEYLAPYIHEWNEVGYGLTDLAKYHAAEIEYSLDTTHFVFLKENFEENGSWRYEISSPLPGRYNVYNTCAVLTALDCLGFDLQTVAGVLNDFKELPGRFERFHSRLHGTVVVDFAHTPNALEQLLSFVQPIVNGRVIVVFGAAGLRDTQKRYLMGEIAGNLAEITILTAEDPRTENVDSIISQIAEGVMNHGVEELPYEIISEKSEVEINAVIHEHNKVFIRIPDRGTAIKTAVKLAKPEDVVLICGKGHEKSMCFGTDETPWSDQQAVEQILKELENGH